MAAKASVVLKEMADKNALTVHGFQYAPAMDAPYLNNETWGKAYQMAQDLQIQLQSLWSQAMLAEADLGEPRTAEECAEAFRAS